MFMYDLEYLDALTWFAVLASFVVYGAGSRTCYNIILRKTTGDVPLFPFIASLYSKSHKKRLLLWWISLFSETLKRGVIWLKYSIMINSVQYAVANFVNTLCQAVYIIIFHSYAKDKKKCHKLLLLFIPLLYGILAYAKYFPKKDVLSRLGYIGCFVTILMTAAPLVSLRDIIRSQSTRMLDFGFIAASFVACGLWTISGILMSDMNVAFPNGVAFFFTIFQLSLFVYYPSKKQSSKDPELSDDTDSIQNVSS